MGKCLDYNLSMCLPTENLGTQYGSCAHFGNNGEMVD